MHGRAPLGLALTPRAATVRRGRGTFGLRAHLVLLIMAVLVPPLALGGAALWQAADTYRGAVEAQVLGTARALALAVNRDIAASLAVATALADMPEAEPDTGDLDEFADLARRLLAPMSAWATLSAADTGQQLVNTHDTAPSPLPVRMTAGGPRDRVRQTGHPTVADLALADAFSPTVIGVLAPVAQNGAVARVVGVWTDPARLSAMLAAQALPQDSFATLVDASGTIVARSADAARFVGTRVSRYDDAMRSGTQLFRSRNLEGRDMLFATAPVAGAPGWVIGVAEPWTRFADAQAGSILRLVAGGMVALAVGGMLAVALARRMLRPVEALASDAALVAAGLAPAPRAPSGIRELDRLAGSIADARETLRERAAAAAQAEAEARAQRDLLRSVINAAAEPVVAKDRQGRYMLANRAAETVLGLPEGRMVGMHNRDLVPAAQAEVAAKADRRVISSGQPETYEHTMASVDGPRIYRTTKMPWRGADGAIIGVVGVSRDVTQARLAQARLDEAQARLLQVSRLGATAAMAAGLAHEINQPLTASANYLRAAARMLGAPGEAAPTPDLLEQARRTLPDAASQAVRAGEILRRLRGFITRGETERQKLHIAPMLRDTLAVLRAALEGEGATLVLDIDQALDDPAMGTVLADPVQLQQVLFNLIRNAAEAMQGQAEARVRLEARHEPEGIVLRVTDRGAGLAPAIMARLFQPFVTTKPNGLGVGLAICRTVVEAHGGTLVATPRQGGGSVFSFTLKPVPVSTPSEAIRSEIGHA